jgi:hypothetical protein
VGVLGRQACVATPSKEMRRTLGQLGVPQGAFRVMVGCRRWAHHGRAR